MQNTKEMVRSHLGPVARGIVGVMAITLAACGGGGSGGGGSKAAAQPAALPGSVVIVEDGPIVGAQVTDASGAVATNVAGNLYQFADDYRAPVFPITVSTRNTISNGVLSGAVQTYQDIDDNGAYQAGVDVPFNASFSQASSVDPLLIYINPITALVPASGTIPAGGIAGVSRAMIESIQTSGLADNTSADIKDVRRLAAQITALAEAAVLLGAPADSVHQVLTELAAAAATNGALDLMADFPAAVNTALGSNTAVQSLYTGVTDPVTSNPVPFGSVGPALTSFATSIDSVTTVLAPNVSKNFEAIIKVLQDAVATDANLGSVETVVANPATDGGVSDAEQLAAAYLALVSAQATAQTTMANQEIGLDNLVQQIYLMPVFYQYDGGGLPVMDACPSCSVGIVDDDLATGTYTVTGFSMDYQPDSDTIVLQDDGASWFSGMVLAATGATSCSLGSDCYRFSNTDGFAEVYMNLEGRRALVYDYGVLYSFATGGSATTHLFPLADQEQICSFSLDNSGSRLLAQAQLDEINLRNAATVSCP